MFFSFYSFARLIAYFRYFLFSSSFILISFYSVLFRLCNFLFIISVTRPFSLSFCLLSALNFFLFFSSFFSASFVSSQCPFVGPRFIISYSLLMTFHFLLIIKKIFLFISEFPFSVLFFKPNLSLSLCVQSYLEIGHAPVVWLYKSLHSFFQTLLCLFLNFE